MHELFNHLWQSTAFGGIITVVCLALRNNHPRVRCWLWVAASLKFLVPFSLLISLGLRMDRLNENPPLTAMTVERISASFAPAPLLSPPADTPVNSSQWPLALAIVWGIGAAIVLRTWLRQWMRLRSSMRGGRHLSLDFPVPVLVTQSSIEPGVFGVFRPVLLLPEGLTTSLPSEQLRGIIAHELCHVRERDNLFAAMHMFVEAMFWFHPLVWWIGARLIEERERACDESVIAEGNAADDYAAGILGVCKFYRESPWPCAAGITGSDLKRRIREIMTQRLSTQLSLSRKAFLVATGGALCGLPIAIGVLRAQTLPPPPQHGYEVVSIRPAELGQRNSSLTGGPQGGVRASNQTVMMLLSFAYDRQEFQFANVQEWVKSTRFDMILTPDKPDVTPSPGMTREEMASLHSRRRQRVQAVLRDRFGLVLRAETREQPMYALVAARNGQKLQRSADTARGPHLSTGRER